MMNETQEQMISEWQEYLLSESGGAFKEWIVQLREVELIALAERVFIGRGYSVQSTRIPGSEHEYNINIWQGFDDTGHRVNEKACWQEPILVGLLKLMRATNAQ